MDYGLFVRRWKLNEFDSKQILLFPFNCSSHVSDNQINNNKDNYNNINNYKDLEHKFNVINELISSDIHLNPKDEQLQLNSNENKEYKELTRILRLNKRVNELTQRNEGKQDLGVKRRKDMEEDLKVLKGLKLKRRIQVPITFKIKRSKRNKSVQMFNSLSSSVIKVSSGAQGESVGLTVNRFEDILRLGEEVVSISKRYLNN